MVSLVLSFLVLTPTRRFVLEHASDERRTKETGLSVTEDEFHTPPEQTKGVTNPIVEGTASKTERTPIHLLKYLSNVDTPTPNSRKITPMPKTTIFVSPPDSSKTPALVDSLGLMSPEEVVRQFPAQNEGSLLPVLGVMTPGKKASQSSVTPSVQLAALKLDSPGNDGKRRDSVFFAPTSSFNESQVKGNLMCFSPLVERDSEEGI